MKTVAGKKGGVLVTDGKEELEVVSWGSGSALVDPFAALPVCLAEQTRLYMRSIIEKAVEKEDADPSGPSSAVDRETKSTDPL